MLVLERQIEREWQWLQSALNAVAQMHAEAALGSLKAFRELHAQARNVDLRRVEIALRIAKLNVARSTARGGIDCLRPLMPPHHTAEHMEVSWPEQSEHAQSE